MIMEEMNSSDHENEIDPTSEILEVGESDTSKEELVTTNSIERKTPEKADKPKIVRLPLARVKHMMKLDPDCGLVSQDAVILVTKATELFLEFLAKESVKTTNVTKRKTLMKKDVDTAIDMVPHLCFLDGALD